MFICVRPEGQTTNTLVNVSHIMCVHESAYHDKDRTVAKRALLLLADGNSFYIKGSLNEIEHRINAAVGYDEWLRVRTRLRIQKHGERG